MVCRASQVLAKFAQDSLANYTPTFFWQCIQMHATLPPTHDLFTSSVETATVTPTHAQLLAVGLHQSICSLRQLRTPLPRPVSQLGLWHNFVVATREEEAFDSVDGDGGTSSWVTSNDSSSWHVTSLSWPSTMWLGSCGRLSLVPTRTVASSTSPSCPAVHARSVHMLLVGYAMEEEWGCHAGPPRSWPSLHETA